MSDTIGVLLIDDHPVVRDGLVAILSTQPDIQIVGEAASGVEAIHLVEEIRPDVVLLDLEMPEMDGVDVIARLKSIDPDVKVLVFTAFDTDDRILGAIKAGAKGYLLKGIPRAELFQAVRVVHQGSSLLQPIVASRLMRSLARDSDRLPVEALTEREHEILGLVAEGLQNKEIAARLSISERTVKFHVSSIFHKLDVGNCTEAVSVAIQNGLIDL